ncbi:zinc finger protein [Aspergillus undulatus]|uniref:zinc finger protein n=1 Tax=Aspergillus undulatus TaxID=1810928 RepID=UPI003CCE0125
MPTMPSLFSPHQTIIPMITKKEIGTENMWSNILSQHQLWVLDFDLVRAIFMDEQGVQQAVNSFWKNDPFFPRPNLDTALWEAFREEYVSTSTRAIKDEALGSPSIARVVHPLTGKAWKKVHGPITHTGQSQKRPSPFIGV